MSEHARAESDEGEADEPRSAPHTTPVQPVEALLGFRDFLAVAPRHDSASVMAAAQAALQRWMRAQGHDSNGFYTMAQWQEFYAATMRST
jgi:hypothetical protein